MGLAWGIVLSGVGAAPAAGQAGNGLYSPFPQPTKHSGFFAQTKIRVTSNDYRHGKFLTPRHLASGLALAPVPPGGASARAGVGDPRDPGTGGWALGIGVVALVAGLGALAPRWARRPRTAG